MTSTSSENRPFHPAELGTLSVIPWSGEAPGTGTETPFLMAYSLGDGPGGREGTALAIRTVLENAGIPVGTFQDGTQHPNFPVQLLVEGGQAVVTMPHLKAQCPVPAEWLDAADACGHAYFVVTTRAWPEAEPGRPVTEEALTRFAGDANTLEYAAHCLVPVRKLRF
ncbi:hypothetical protein DY218_27595 [Streptomyces triticagri]|uniref:Uncharacterized protein n=1 Tax=Streptomyces triticagri TaxID=2293568 RepID=A0A372LXU8_9ACTN|nr:DUF5949 family protein [Streptomyces triticagri]RFU83482.1 hypothetical protein DY218_27595 [Streptomyces triticagri]